MVGHVGDNFNNTFVFLSSLLLTPPVRSWASRLQQRKHELVLVCGDLRLCMLVSDLDLCVLVSDLDLCMLVSGDLHLCMLVSDDLDLCMLVSSVLDQRGWLIREKRRFAIISDRRQ